MTDDVPPPKADRTQLQQIIAGLNDGVILVDPDQTIAWANAMALALHGVTALKELGATVSEYRQRFELTYRNQHKLPEGDYPMERLLAGEAFSEVRVSPAMAGLSATLWSMEDICGADRCAGRAGKEARGV